jgi:predicted metal-dependent hydrolase
VEVHYILRSSLKAKRMQMRIAKEGRLEIVVPHRINIEEGKRFLNKNMHWVEKHIENLKPKQKKFLYGGRSFTPVLFPEATRQKYLCRFHEDEIHIYYPAGCKESAYDIFSKFQKVNARKYLPQRCVELAQKYGFKVNKVTVRGQKSRWGSCSRRGNISLNYKLLQFRVEMIDYVIIHELCHLRQPNHSKAFWNEVAKHIPNYKTLDKELNSLRIF